jgi:hypothetical protein
MAANAISHHTPRRKRWGPYMARRLLALGITVTALGAVSWLAPMLRAPEEPAPPLPERSETRAEAPALEPVFTEANVTLDLAPARAAPRARVRRLNGIPLNAAAEAVSEGYEILSATELDAISQARD